jgi:hypothetical protein
VARSGRWYDGHVSLSPAVVLVAAWGLWSAPPTVLTDDAAERAEGETEGDAIPTSQSARVGGVLTIGPGHAGMVRILGQDGQLVATVELRAAEQRELRLAAGTYRVVTGEETRSVELESGRRARVVGSEGRGGSTAESQARRPWTSVASIEADPGDDVAIVDEPEHLDEPALAKASVDPESTKRTARRRALASVIFPGAGAILNDQAPKGAGIFVGSALLAGMSIWTATPSKDPTRQDFANEAARLSGHGLLTGGLTLLYAGQIMNAYQVALGRPVESARTQRVNVQLGRMLTVGVRPGRDEVGYYRNWSMAILGQPVRRMELGVSDLGVVVGSRTDRVAAQAGLRAGYRAVERRAVWLTLSAGALGQLVFARPERDALRTDGSGAAPDQFAVGSAAFGQIQLSAFLADHWSLDVTPRFSLPLSTRYFGNGLAIARFSPTFELGTGIGAHF